MVAIVTTVAQLANTDGPGRPKYKVPEETLLFTDTWDIHGKTLQV